MQEIRNAGDVVHFTFDDANRPTRVQLRTGLNVDNDYDDANQLRSISYANAGGPIGNLMYQFDALGRVIHIGGSLANVNLPAAMSGAAYNDHNQLTTWNGASYTYDENGNLTSDGIRSFTWNARDELIQITGGSTTAQFSYDAMGRRRRKSVNSAATKYLYDGSNILQERNDDDSLRASFLPGFGMDRTYGRTKGSVKTEYLVDRLGSTIGIADASGTVLTNYSYEPFGKATLSGAADDNERTFTGREDDGTGLLYYRARYYDPSSGRFISEDPLGLGGGDFNVYRYVAGDPINRSDRSGLLFGGLINAGEGYGEYAAQYWADLYTSSEGIVAWAAGFMGTLASLWTPCTSDQTFLVLTSAWSVGSLAAKGLDAASIRFTQSTASATFRNGKFAGQTIGKVASGLRSGAISPSQLPIDVIVRDGNLLSLNTRSTLALMRGGISPSNWTLVNQTGNSFFEAVLDARLAANELTSAGTDVLRITGGGARVSVLW